MTDLTFEMDEWKDFEAINVYGQLQTMMHLPKFLAQKVIQHKTRDNARTPVQWTGGEYAGFSTVKPWIKLNPNHKMINILAQENDADSVLNFTRAAIKLWKSNELFTFGTIEGILVEHPQVLAFLRKAETASYIVLINLDDKPATFNLHEEWCGETLLNSVFNNQPLIKKMVFKPYEARVARLK